MCYYISGIIADCATPARLTKLKGAVSVIC
jgi:hypothetical protein